MYMNIHTWIYVHRFIFHSILSIFFYHRKEGTASSVDAQGHDADVSAGLGQSDSGVC